jgi:hypothetical protein
MYYDHYRPHPYYPHGGYYPSYPHGYPYGGYYPYYDYGGDIALHQSIINSGYMNGVYQNALINNLYRY